MGHSISILHPVEISAVHGGGEEKLSYENLKPLWDVWGGVISIPLQEGYGSFLEWSSSLSNN